MKLFKKTADVLFYPLWPGSLLTKRQWSGLAVFVGSTSLIIGILAMLPAREKLLMSRFDRIQEGMTPAEVESILGFPPDGTVRGTPGVTTDLSWYAPGESMAVVFWLDPEGVYRMRGKHYYIGPEESILQRLMRWLRLR